MISLMLKCDGCGTQYESRRRTRDTLQTHHWCSRECIGMGFKKGGILNEKVQDTCSERYGVNWPSKIESVEQTRKQTCLERYGHVSPMQNPDVQQTRKQTCLERYGVDNVAKDDNVIAKMHRTNIQRYGAKSPLKNKDVYNKVDWKSAVQKNHASMKANGSYRKSNPEDKFYHLLIEKFGINNIERQAQPSTTNWPIDFYVKSINTWIQIDGVYWHGLDRPLEEHLRSKNPRSKSIVGKWEIDRKQERWFAEHNMKLMRFTDKEVLAMKECPAL